MHNCAETLLEVALSKTIIGACFFAKRSCMFSVTTGNLKTAIVALCYIYFLHKNNSTILYDSDEILIAFSISVTFINQKNSQKMDRIANHNTSNAVLNPVQIFRALICYL